MLQAIIVIGVIAGSSLGLLVITLIRLRALESFVLLLSVVVLGEKDKDEVLDYLRARLAHPAGRKLPSTSPEDN